MKLTKIQKQAIDLTIKKLIKSYFDNSGYETNKKTCPMCREFINCYGCPMEVFPREGLLAPCVELLFEHCPSALGSIRVENIPLVTGFLISMREQMK